MKKLVMFFYRIVYSTLVIILASTCTSMAQGMAGHEMKMTDQDMAAMPLSGEVKNSIRIVNVKAFQYGFDPEHIVVNQGDKVQVDVKSLDVAHGFAIAEYNVDVNIPAGEVKSVVFTADTKGVFDIVCSVFCGPGHSHMKAMLIVK